MTSSYSHFATNNEGWKTLNYLSTGIDLKLNPSTVLDDHFGKSGITPHPILWNAVDGNWVSEYRYIGGIYDPDGFILTNNGVGSLTFYNNFDISNRSNLTGSYMKFEVQFQGSNATWTINDDITISGYPRCIPTFGGGLDCSRPEYGIGIFSASETTDGGPGGSKVVFSNCEGTYKGVSSKCNTVPSQSTFGGNNITINLVSNPSGDAAIVFARYAYPSYTYLGPYNYYSPDVNCYFTPTAYTATITGMSSTRGGAGKFCGIGTEHYVDCESINGTYILPVCSIPSIYGFEITSKYPIDDGAYLPSYTFYDRYKKATTWYGDVPYGIVATNGPEFESTEGSTISGVFNILDGPYYDPTYGIINMGGSGVSTTGGTWLEVKDDGSIGPPVGTPKPFRCLLQTTSYQADECSTYRDPLASPCYTATQLGYTTCDCFMLHDCLSVFDPSRYENGYVYYNPAVYNINSGTLTFGRFEYIYDGELYSVPSGKIVNIMKKGDVESHNYYIDYNIDSDTMQRQTGIYPTDLTIGNVIYSPIISIPAGNENRQLVYPHGTFYQNISTYRNLNDFTIEKVDYEYGKGTNLLKIIPTGENFEYYCRKYHNNSVRYHKLQPILTTKYNYGAIADNTSSPLKGVSFVGTQTNTYTATSIDDNTRHIITPDTNNMDLVYKITIESGGIPSNLYILGFLSGVNDVVDVYGYNNSRTDWDLLGSMPGRTVFTDNGQNFPIQTAHYDANNDIYIRLNADNLINQRLHLDLLRTTYKINSPYRLAFNYNDDIIVASGHTVNQLPLVEVHWSGDLTKNNSFGYDIYDIRPPISGDGTKTGFDNVYPLITATDYWQDDGTVVSTSTSGNVLRVNLNPDGERDDYSFYYRDQKYTKTNDFVDIPNAMGKRWFIVYKDDTLTAYSGSITTSLNTSYTNQQIADITGTGLLVAQYYINNITPSYINYGMSMGSSPHHSATLKRVDCWNYSKTLYPSTGAGDCTTGSCFVYGFPGTYYWSYGTINNTCQCNTLGATVVISPIT